MRRALAAAVMGILLVPGVLLADDAAPSVPALPSPTAPAAAPSGDGAAAPEAAETQTQTQTQPSAPPPAPVVKAARKQPAAKKPPKVHAAAAGSVTIQNFAFAPATINVKAGDTVTWTNRDSTAHTATSSGSGFNTGLLKKGQSASHTFSTAGRFPYICAIHPNMHGTVVVAAAAAAGSSTSSGSSASTTPRTGSQPATSAPHTGPTLPNTGLQLGVVALVGALFTLSGAGLRRRTRS